MIAHSSHAAPRHTPPWGRFVSPEHPLWNWYIGERLPQGWWRHRSPWPVSVALPLAKEQGAIFGQDDADLDATLLRLAFNAARNGWKVFLFDAHGSPENAARFVTAMTGAHYEHTYVFPQNPYHGWQGNNMQVFHRLLQACPPPLIDTLARQGGGRQRNGHGSPPLPPATPPSALQSLETAASSLRYGTLVTLAGSLLSGEWSYDHADAAYLSFPTYSRPEQARFLARFLLADFTRYLAERTCDTRPVLLLIKHPTALFEASQLFSLSALVAAHQSSLFVAAHTPANFGRDTYRLLHSTKTLILHRSVTPEPFEPLLLVSGGRQRFFSRTLRTLPPLHSFILQAGDLVATRIAPVRLERAMLQSARLRIPSLWTGLDEEWVCPEHWPPLPARQQAPVLLTCAPKPQTPPGQPANAPERQKEPAKRRHRQREGHTRRKRRGPISAAHHKPRSSKGRTRRR